MINSIAFFLILVYVYIISKKYYSKCSPEQKIIFLILFFIHFSTMILAYCDTIIDANVFYEKAKMADSWFSIFGLGSQFMSFLIYPLVVIGASKLLLYFLFSSLSFQAFIWYFENMEDSFSSSENPIITRITQLFFLLPSFHYWSGFVGKDALIFFIMTYLFFEVKNNKTLNFFHLIVLILFLLLRPHVFLFYVLAFFLYFLFVKKTDTQMKFKLFISASVFVCFFLPIIMRFLGMDGLSLELLIELWQKLNLYSTSVNNGIDLNQTNIFKRIGLLLFRPMFYDASTFYQYMISIENSLVLLLLLFSVYYLFIKRTKKNITEDVKLATLIGLFIMIMIATYIYNLGLASRMRLMFLPFILYAVHQTLFYSFSKNKFFINN